MYSLPYLVLHLYPTKSQKEVDVIAEACFHVVEYSERDWPSVIRTDLALDGVQHRLIRTLWHAQFGYEGVHGLILQSFLEWSGDDFDFSFLPLLEAEQFSYRYYMILGFVSFPYVSKKHQVFLLGSKCLLLAAVWEVLIYLSVQKFFSTLVFVGDMKEYAQIFADAIQYNPTEFGRSAKIQRTIGWWVNLFERYQPKVLAEKVPEFMAAVPEIKELAEDEKNVLEKIITVYFGLVSSVIWTEISESEAAGYASQKSKSPQAVDSYYVQQLENLDQSQLTRWLSDYKNVARWVITSGLEEKILLKIFTVLRKKVDVNNIEQVQYTISFVEALQSLGWKSLENLFFFDEGSGSFQWNKEFFPSDTLQQGNPRAV